jgi:hypothetical protein
MFLGFVAEEEQLLIERALRHIELKTCLKFIQRQSQQSYITFKKSSRRQVWRYEKEFHPLKDVENGKLAFPQVFFVHRTDQPSARHLSQVGLHQPHW